jgi:hypothetical protein
MAFDKGAQKLASILSDKLKLDDKVCVQGQDKDGTLFVSSFVLLDTLNEVHGRKLTPREPPRHPLDTLMDMLSPAYVTKRFREFCRTSDITKVLRGFDTVAYQKFLHGLWEEAALKEIEKSQGKVSGL